jgi:hypothetical protein
MIELRELGQLCRLITPLRLFFFGAIIAAVIAGFCGLMAGLVLLEDRPVRGMMVIGFTICAICVFVLFVRLVTEFFLISSRTNCHLYAIRFLLERAEQMELSANQQQTHLSRAA